MTDTEQPMAAENTMAPTPGIDWREVVRDMSVEHVARLAVDASVLRVELDAARLQIQRMIRDYGRLVNEHSSVMELIQEFAEKCGELETENAALRQELAAANQTLCELKPAPARAAPRKRAAARGR